MKHNYNNWYYWASLATDNQSNIVDVQMIRTNQVLDMVKIGTQMTENVLQRVPTAHLLRIGEVIKNGRDIYDLEEATKKIIELFTEDKMPRLRNVADFKLVNGNSKEGQSLSSVFGFKSLRNK